MHSNTITAKLLYEQHASFSSSQSPSKMKRIKSNLTELNKTSDVLNTDESCNSLSKCNCVYCQYHINEIKKDDLDMLFPMDE